MKRVCIAVVFSMLLLAFSSCAVNMTPNALPSPEVGIILEFANDSRTINETDPEKVEWLKGMIDGLDRSQRSRGPWFFTALRISWEGVNLKIDADGRYAFDGEYKNYTDIAGASDYEAVMNEYFWKDPEEPFAAIKMYGANKWPCYETDPENLAELDDMISSLTYEETQGRLNEYSAYSIVRNGKTLVIDEKGKYTFEGDDKLYIDSEGVFDYELIRERYFLHTPTEPYIEIAYGYNNYRAWIYDPEIMAYIEAAVAVVQGEETDGSEFDGFASLQIRGENVNIWIDADGNYYSDGKNYVDKSGAFDFEGILDLYYEMMRIEEPDIDPQGIFGLEPSG